MEDMEFDLSRAPNTELKPLQGYHSPRLSYSAMVQQNNPNLNFLARGIPSCDEGDFFGGFGDDMLLDKEDLNCQLCLLWLKRNGCLLRHRPSK